MRWTRTLIPTLRQTPAEAVVPSHRLMLRAGLIQQVGAGAYSYLPLGWRALRKVMEIVRQEMDRAGAVEVLLPAIQPVDLWERTGRRADYGQNLFVVKDRHGRELALGPTHEEVITDLMRRSVGSYRDLPITLYQIQTKFRDEYRPRFGVLRSREFQMKDAYSFDLDSEGLDRSYQAMYEAYRRIFDRCGLDYVVVEAESGPIGGSASHEFMVLTPTGEDVILSSDKGNYAANVEKCEIGPRTVSESFKPIVEHCNYQVVEFTPAAEPTGKLEQVHTPDCPGIEDVCAFFEKQLGSKLKSQNMLKTLVYESTISSERLSQSRLKSRQSGAPAGYRHAFHHFMVVTRGDHEVNESKLRSIILERFPDVEALQLADQERAKEWLGMPIGYLGPSLITDPKWGGVWLVVDPDVAVDQFWVTGANEVDHHVKHFNWKRDVLEPLGGAAKDRVIVADIRNAQDGDPAPAEKGGGILRESRGIEVGHVFKLGTKYADALGLRVLDEHQRERPVIMGCYGIGVNRIIAAAIESERGHDEHGIIWPMAIAPYQALITPVKYEGRVKEEADRLYEHLAERGIDVLLDDRDERPGVKFKDADLIGIPLRITIGEKSLSADPPAVELKPRTSGGAELVPLAEAAARTAELVARRRADFRGRGAAPSGPSGPSGGAAADAVA